MQTGSVPSSRSLDEWVAVPLAVPLENATEAQSIERPWRPVRVPGHWQLEGAFAAYEGLVLYRCRFAHSSCPGGEMQSLRFGGVYYSARIWLNGTYLGGHEGYFAQFEFDVTGVLFDGENELLVEVYSPEEPDENDRRTVGGVWARWDGMAPHINPGGIFREVRLVVTGAVYIRSLCAVADHEGDGRAHVELYTRRASRIKLVGRVRPVGFEVQGDYFEREVHLKPGPNRFELGFHLPRVRAWWTWERGEQPLYELALGCGDVEEVVRFGARTVELRDWKVFLNGELLFLRGINYLPTDAYPARASRERLRADASLVRGAGMNAVRVHAHVAEGGFYEACDEMGLLILQDFPLQWTHRRSILKPAVAQAAEMARGLYSHPSVGVYLAHDEPFYVAPPEKWGVRGLLRTASEVLAPRWALWQRRVLDPAVVSSIKGKDGSRPVIEAAGHPLTTNHLYFGWYYGGFRDLERAVRLFPGLSRLPTEYGAQALPDPESLEEIWPAGQGPNWNALALNFRLQVRRMERYVRWKGHRTAYVRETQRYQAEVLKHATELFRRLKYGPTGGTFAFMLNDPAPAISWSVVDWRRRPKAAYDVLKTSMAPILICAEYPERSYDPGAEISLALFVVNDLPRGLGRVEWKWEIYLDGIRTASGGAVADVPKDSVVEIGRARAMLTTPGDATLRLQLFGDGLEAANEYEFLVSETPGSPRPSTPGG